MEGFFMNLLKKIIINACITSFLCFTPCNLMAINKQATINEPVRVHHNNNLAYYVRSAFLIALGIGAVMILANMDPDGNTTVPNSHPVDPKPKPREPFFRPFDDNKNEEWKRQNTKACPNCNIRFERDG